MLWCLAAWGAHVAYIFNGRAGRGCRCRAPCMALGYTICHLALPDAGATDLLAPPGQYLKDHGRHGAEDRQEVLRHEAPQDFIQALGSLPDGSTHGTFKGATYIATKSTFNSGRSFKLVAQELGGPDYISLNVYLLASGARVYPCEMSREKVVKFVLGFQPDPDCA